MKIENIDNIDESIENQYLYNQVKRCIFRYRKLLLAFSGGLDSTVLLDILATLVKNSNVLTKSTGPITLKAVYVHHGISNESDKWANHCQEQCNIRHIPFDIIYINCLSSHKKYCNLESRARNLRYKGLCNHLESDEVLLTAHHMDDQLETVLLALKRGSGPAGLSGIYQDIILYSQYQLLRPLLQCTRMQLKTYAIQKKLIWIEDEANTDIRFDRNFLRIKIIPILQKRWPAFSRVVARTAQLCRNQENLMHELLLESLSKLIDVNGALFFVPLLRYSVFKRQAILRLWLKRFFIYMPSYQLLNRIWKEVILSKIDANPILYLGTYICRRFRKKLYILPIDMALTVNIPELSWSLINKTMLLPCRLGLLISQVLTINDCSLKNQIELNINSDLLLDIFFKCFKMPGKILTNCLIRFPQSNEKISIRFGHVCGLLNILNRNRNRKLKKIWQELQIPPWLRSRIPLLFYNNTLIAAIGVFITQNGQVTHTNQMRNNHYKVWRVSWLQDITRYDFFKNIIHHDLK